MDQFTPGTAGHGPKGGYRADLEVLRQYFRDNDPSYAAYSRRSPGGAKKRRRARASQKLTVAQERLLDFAKSKDRTETWLMDQLQAKKLVPNTRVWLHELSDKECKKAFGIFEILKDSDSPIYAKGALLPSHQHEREDAGVSESGLTPD